VRVATNDERCGGGHLSFESDTTATVLHRQVARHVPGSDPAQIDVLVDRVIDANTKFYFRSYADIFLPSIFLPTQFRSHLFRRPIRCSGNSLARLAERAAFRRNHQSTTDPSSRS
jgi:hypothetical protein